MQEQQPQMTVETALNLVDQVCAEFRGSRTDHINLQVAVQTLREALPETPNTGSEDDPVQEALTPKKR